MILCIIIALLVGILEAALFVLPTACLGAAPILTDTNDEKPAAFAAGFSHRGRKKRGRKEDLQKGIRLTASVSFLLIQ